MAEQKIFAGPRVRRIRQRLEKTQTAMAQELGISPSYLNLIERNQRPLTAQLVLKIVGTYDIDVAELSSGGEEGSVAALKEVFADPLLSGELPGDTELIEIADAAPNAAQGIVKLYRAYREQRERLSDMTTLMGQAGHDLATPARALPLDRVRAVLEDVPWCFPGLERAAIRILDALKETGDRTDAFNALLRAEHGLAVQVLPVETMPVWRKRIDRHSGRLFVSERLSLPERAELLAQELVLRREGKALDEEAELLGLTAEKDGEEAMRLLRLELARYAALAVLMPYDRFLMAAERTHYDLPVLATRFGCSQAQVAHRLVSLQDKSDGRRAGLPFFSMEVDRAGTVLRRLGAKGFPASRFGGACPKLGLYAAFAHPGQLVCERVVTPAGEVFITLSLTVEGVVGNAGERPKTSALLLGIEDPHAKAVMEAGRSVVGKMPVAPITSHSLPNDLAHVRLLPDVQAVGPVEIGPACRLCERVSCTSRSAPPLSRPQGLDDLVQGFGAYGLT